MYQVLRTVYGRLLLIPAIGPMFRIPVLTWRAIFGSRTGLGMTASSREDALAIAIAAIEGLRDDVRALRTQQRGLTENAGRLREEVVTTEAQLREAMAAIEQRLAEAAAATEQRLAEAAAATEQRLRDRIEFARAETMFELRTYLPGNGIPPAAAVQPRILEQAKVEAMRAAGSMRLNVGCGHVPLEGYVNVDMRALPGVDVVAEAGALPFEAETVAEIHSAHLLEHFPVEQLRRVVLPHWRALLRPGGELRAVVPDAEAMLADFAAGLMPFDDLREVTYGLQEYAGDFHFNMFSREGLRTLLREAGFADVSFAFQGRQNGKCRDMEIRGVRA